MASDMIGNVMWLAGKEENSRFPMLSAALFYRESNRLADIGQ